MTEKGRNIKARALKSNWDGSKTHPERTIRLDTCQICRGDSRKWMAYWVEFDRGDWPDLLQQSIFNDSMMLVSRIGIP